MLKIILIQVSFFIIGCLLLLIDGSNGMISEMSFISYIGISCIIIGVGINIFAIIIQKIIAYFKE